jgi:hypothetical protein
MAALTVSVVLHADQKKADEKFCGAVASFQSNAAELKAIGPHATMAEVRAASRRIDNDVEQMKSAASKMKTPAAKQFLVAMKQLNKDVSSIPDDATLQQVHSKIEADARDARTSGRQVAAEAGCPQAPPADQSE